MSEKEPSVLTQAPKGRSTDSPAGSSDAPAPAPGDDDSTATAAESNTPSGTPAADDAPDASAAESTTPATTPRAVDAPDASPAESNEPPTASVPRPKPRRRRQAPTFYVAGFWRRIAAAMVDLAIILPVATVLVFLVSKIAGLALPPGRNRGLDFWLDMVLANDPAVMGGIGLTLAIALVYILVFQIVLGYTLGMRAVKIRIIDVYGDRVSTGRSIARTAGYVGCLATLSLGFLWIGFDAEKRGLHDWVSGTYVVKA